MKAKTLYIVFISLVALVVFVQLPVWFLLSEMHSRAGYHDRDAENDVLSFDGVGVDDAVKDTPRPSQRMPKQEKSMKSNWFTSASSLSGRLLKGYHNPETAHVSHIVVFELDTTDIDSLPWHLFAEAGAFTSVSGVAAHVMIVTAAPPMSLRLTARLCDIMAALGVQCASMTHTNQETNATVFFDLVTVAQGDVSAAPDTLRRNAWHLMPLFCSRALTTIPHMGASGITSLLTFIAPAAEVSVDWGTLLQRLHSAVSDSSPAGLLLAHGIVSRGRTLADGHKIVAVDEKLFLSPMFSGYPFNDLRLAQEDTGQAVVPTPFAFSASVAQLVGMWPEASPQTQHVVPYEWAVRDTDGLCAPETSDYYKFLTASILSSDVSIRRSGVSVSLSESAHPCSPSAALATSVDMGHTLRKAGCNHEDVTLALQRAATLNTALHFSDTLLVEWDTFCIACFGFTNEVMQYIVPLDDLLEVRSTNDPSCFCSGNPNAFEETLSRLSRRDSAKERWLAAKKPSARVDRASNSTVLVHISHKDPGSFPRFSPSQRPDVVVGRAMYEFTKVPSPWLQHKDDVDEIWVPCRFVYWVFEHAGFPSEKLQIIPEPIDVFQYDPAVVSPIVLPRDLSKDWNQASNYALEPSTAMHFNFFSVFKWEDRKGWDILLRAYCGAFSRSSNVSLYLSTYIYGAARDASLVLEKIRTYVENDINISWDVVPHIHVISEQLTEADMVQMYASVDAFVMPTKGEGWGLPAVQAMSMALPTIVTNWSGIVDFASGDNSFLIPLSDVEELPLASPYGFETGKLWGVPNALKLRETMLQVATDPAEAYRRGAKARRDVVAQFSREAVAHHIKNRVLFLADAAKRSNKDKVRDAVEALLDSHHLIV